MANVLVVYHSRTGHCRTVAETLGQKRGWTLAEVVYRQGLQTYGRCARDALLRGAPEIGYTGPDPARFDVVVLVSPIWCWRLCPPMRSFLQAMNAKLGSVAVLSCMGGSGAGNAVAEVERLIRRPVVAKIALRQDEVESGRHTDALQAFADEVAACASARARPRPAAVAAQAA